MGERKTLFSDSVVNTRIQATANFLRAWQTDSEVEQKSRIRLATAFEIVATNGESFDENCQFNIEHIGSQLTAALVEYGGRATSIDAHRLSALLLRFICEYDLSVARELSPELRGFVDGVVVESINFSPELKAQVEYAQHRMPVAILKQLLSSDDFVSLRNVQQIAKNTEDRLSWWNEEISKAEVRVDGLKSTLVDQEKHFNFVGLNKGFENLGGKIESELKSLRTRLICFGTLLLVPVTTEFLAITRGWIDVNVSTIQLVASAIASVTATLLLLYFFRITLHNADTCRAQLIQVRLRMALCQFIQSYADYSTEIRAKNVDALSKFESLIFSGIVSKEEKLPSTFDGLEQLGEVLKNLRGGK